MRSLLVFALTAVAAARSILPQTHSPFVARNVTLPSSFKWTSSGALVSPKKDSRKIAGIKDPSIIFYKDTYHVFASTAVESGYNLVYFNFTDFNKANDAKFFYLDQSGIGTGYRAAPEVFYFEPQKLWYLIYQNGNAAYSTNKDISNPAGWSAPKTFYSGTPALIEKGLKSPEQGYWVDMWVICDDINCHLFSSDDNGRLYRSQTTLAKFPNGMSDPVIAMQAARKQDLFEASAIYNVGNGLYLMVVECIGSGASNAGGVRYFRSWTATSLAGPWKTLAATQDNPFLGAANTNFPGGKWTTSLSHGELIRSDVDQNLKVTPCGMRFLYQGIDPSASGSYNALPWKLGLVTQVGGC